MSTKPVSKRLLYRLAGWAAALVTAVLLVIVTLGTLAQAQAAQETNGSIWYAAPTAAGMGDCASWENACELSMALLYAAYGDQIWVKAGVHYPGVERSATFTLTGGVAVYGGFAGTETAVAQRDWQANPTVLSGDVDQNDWTDARGVVTATTNITGGNAYNVVTAVGVTETAVLDGFIITGGYADGASTWPCVQRCGAGLRNQDGSPSLRHLTFSGNYAESDGGGMYISGGGPSLSDVLFENNVAGHGGGAAIYYNYNDEYAPELTAVTFKNNEASWYGGGLYNGWGSKPTLNNVTFSGNSADYNGGGLYNSSQWITITNSFFDNNTAVYYGGGMYDQGGGDRGLLNEWGNKATLINVAFSHNSAEYGGGMYSGWGNNATLRGVTFYNNSASYSGGGLYDGGSGQPALTDVSFKSNSANAGGGMYNNGYGRPVLTNVIFSGNSAEGVGGGMYNGGAVALELTNVLFSGNSAEYGGGMYSEDYSYGPYNGSNVNEGEAILLTNVVFSGNWATVNGGGMHNANVAPAIRNSIFWHNQDASGVGTAAASLFNYLPEQPSAVLELPTPAVSYSLIQGCNPDGLWDAACGLDAGNNLADADPLFRATPDPANAPTTEGNLRLRSGSPAIDVGNNDYVADAMADLDGKSRIFNDTVDLGPYEWRPETLYLPVIIKH